MNWYKRSLLKRRQTFADKGGTQTAPSPGFSLDNDYVDFDSNNTSEPESYYDIGDAGNPSVESNDCNVFAWVWSAGWPDIRKEEVWTREQTHDTLFRGMDRQRQWSGRFDSCRGQASATSPSNDSMRRPPGALVSMLVKHFGRLGMKQLWWFSDTSKPEMVWQG